MSRVSFHDLAIKELLDARDYYDSILHELGKHFLYEIEDVIQKVRLFPFSFPVSKNQIRKALVKKFPYCILFRATQNEIFILAVMHQKRKPFYWIERS